MNVDKAAQALTSFSLQPRGPFRVAGVLKVEAGEAEGRLEVVKPGFAPTFVWIKAAGTGRLFGVFQGGPRLRNDLERLPARQAVQRPVRGEDRGRQGAGLLTPVRTSP